MARSPEGPRAFGAVEPERRGAAERRMEVDMLALFVAATTAAALAPRQCAPSGPPVPIACGQDVTGAIASPGQEHVYPFQVSAPGVIYLTIQPTAGCPAQPGFSPRADLFGPLGLLAISNNGILVGYLAGGCNVRGSRPRRQLRRVSSSEGTSGSRRRFKCQEPASTRSSCSTAPSANRRGVTS
jgi:hypothetical protein